MANETVATSTGGPGRKWVLPAILALLIIAIVAGAFFATHPHIFGSSKTATPTPTATATPRPTATPTHTPGPTATPRPGPTGTPRPGPTATPRPGPTGTPRPGPTATPKPPTSALKLGKVTYSAAQLNAIQNGANQGNAAYTYYLSPFKVVQKNLPKYFGFTAGPVTILSPPPPPAPTPTPYSNNQGLPTVKIKVQYQGKTYIVTLDQPRQTGPQGIWVITNIAAG